MPDVVISSAGVDPERVDHVVFGNLIHPEPGDAFARCPSDMERGGHDLGAVTLCIAGGQGIALLLERG